MPQKASLPGPLPVTEWMGAMVETSALLLHIYSRCPLEHRVSSAISLLRLDLNHLHTEKTNMDTLPGGTPSACPQPCSGSTVPCKSGACFEGCRVFILCCFANPRNCFPLLSFYKRRSAIMTQENTLKATAPSSSFFLNIQRSWKGKLLRFTRQNSGE